MSDFISQTELGRMFGVSSHGIGKWLIECGLRTTEKKPSHEAFEGGYVSQAPSRNECYFYVWNQEKTIAALKSAGHRIKRQYEPPTESRLSGPFEARKNSRNRFELIDSNGEVGIWVVGQSNADRLLRLLNLAHQHGQFN